MVKIGLDMYLYAKWYIWSDKKNEKIREDIKKLIPTAQDLKPKEIEFEAGYWRKANAIHKWFVDNIQDGKDECQETYVNIKQLKELKKLCKQAIKEMQNAKKILPTQSGFFFGGTEYDIGYFEDIEHTIKIIEKIEKLGDGFEFYYRSSW